MYNPILLPELREMLEAQDHAGLTEVAVELHPATVAEFSEGLTADEIWQLLDHASTEQQAQIFTYYPFPKQEELCSGVGRDRMSRLLEEMPHDDRADLLRHLDSDFVEDLLPLVARADRNDIRMLLSCSENSAGALMTTEYASLPEEITVGEALVELRRQAPDRETIYYVYVLDDQRRLRGSVSLRDLILAKPSARLGDIMQQDPVRVQVDEDRELVARTLAKYNFLAIPVVDDQQRLVGIVTHDDVIDVMVEEATEDAQHMGAVMPLEENHLEAPFAMVWRRRSMWLSCLFVAELLTFAAMAHFEDAIATIVALAFFVPLCISTGGNSGSQAATLITRALALGQVQPSDWWRVVKHELMMGFALGITLGLIAFLQASLMPTSIVGEVNRVMLALVVSQSVTLICVWGTLVGSLMPLAFQQIGFDPGYASSPFVATFVDVTGIIIYFSIAKVYLL